MDRYDQDSDDATQSPILCNFVSDDTRRVQENFASQPVSASLAALDSLMGAPKLSEEQKINHSQDLCESQGAVGYLWASSQAVLTGPVAESKLRTLADVLLKLPVGYITLESLSAALSKLDLRILLGACGEKPSSSAGKVSLVKQALLALQRGVADTFEYSKQMYSIRVRLPDELSAVESGNCKEVVSVGMPSVEVPIHLEKNNPRHSGVSGQVFTSSVHTTAATNQQETAISRRETAKAYLPMLNSEFEWSRPSDGTSSH